MKFRFVSAAAMTVALFLNSQVEANAITNGVILISTRAPQDTAAGSEYATDQDGPGMVSPGDVAMEDLLGDYGYNCRLVLDRILNGAAQAWCSAPPLPDIFTDPPNANMAPMLIILSGSSSGADVPPRNTNGIPTMIGEHTDLADRNNPGSMFMYSNGSSSIDPNQGTNATLYMKIINTNHPIVQGIPLDAQGRVKIFRDRFPEENAHTPIGGVANYEYRWCGIPAANAAAGTTVLGVLDGSETLSVFAVAEVGGILAFNANLGYAATNDARLVHLFANEQGSGGPRRVFLSLTDMGRVLFVRAAKWAMGETLAPYQGLGLLEVSMVGSSQIRLSWQGSADKNYKILGTRNLTGPADFSNWQTVLQDIPGTNGVISRKLSIANAAEYAFLKIAPMP